MDHLGGKLHDACPTLFAGITGQFDVIRRVIPPPFKCLLDCCATPEGITQLSSEGQGSFCRP